MRRSHKVQWIDDDGNPIGDTSVGAANDQHNGATHSASNGSVVTSVNASTTEVTNSSLHTSLSQIAIPEPSERENEAANILDNSLANTHSSTATSPSATSLTGESLISQTSTGRALADKPLVGKPLAGNQQRNDDLIEDQALNRALAQADPLTLRPRESTQILAVVIGLAFAIIAVFLYLIAVCSLTGQIYDDLVWSTYHESVGYQLQMIIDVLSQSTTIIIISAVIVAIAGMITIIRKRWFSLLQFAFFGVLCLACDGLKYVLPRPFLTFTESIQANSAPSGHTLLVMAVLAMLVMAVGSAFRAITALIASVLAWAMALVLVIDQWHRPSDVVLSMMLAGMLACCTMAATRKSGMDTIGSRRSSPSIQIVASMMITFGVAMLAYGGYVLWQIAPGLQYSATYVIEASNTSTTIIVGGVSLVTFGVILVIRQLTACPLTRIGLVGAPPPPPSEPASTALAIQ